MSKLNIEDVNKDLQRAKYSQAQNEIQSQGVITPEQRKLEQWRMDQVGIRIEAVLKEGRQRLYTQSEMTHALVASICTFIDQECQSAVKNYVCEQDQKKQENPAARRADSTDPRQLQRANEDTDPATRYAAYANVLASCNVTNLTASLLRAIDGIVDLSKNWSK